MANYYHGSNVFFEKNEKLLPGEKGYVEGCTTQELEFLFEEERPFCCIPRHAAVYLSPNPDLIDPAGGYTDVIYEVQPLTPVEFSDLAWYTEAQQHLEVGETEQAKLCAAKYWKGLPYSDLSQSCPEIRCGSAMVTHVVEGPDAGCTEELSHAENRSRTVWATLHDFLADKGDQVIESNFIVHDEDGYYHRKGHHAIEIAGDVYKTVFDECMDNEGHDTLIEWYRNDVLHRDGFLPARYVNKESGVPAEQIYDQYCEDFVINSWFIGSRDENSLNNRQTLNKALIDQCAKAYPEDWGADLCKFGRYEKATIREIEF
ncbi:hypothetical protein [Neptuniibacter sp. QD37_11]|uniref:hypothetical protein n=1 Tax=Neptuniibacter sp. QD37_11 TaxID=3398209 RepID=UPI0039F61C04